MTQFLSRHGIFAAKLHSMALVETPSRSACGHEHDGVEHALWSCSVLDRDIEVPLSNLNESDVQDFAFDELVTNRLAFTALHKS